MFFSKSINVFLIYQKILKWESEFELTKALQNLIFFRIVLIKSHANLSRINVELALLSDIKVYL